MSLTALTLILIASLLHATWNYNAKKVSGGAPFVFLYELIAFLFYCPLLFFFDLSAFLNMGWSGLGLVLLSGIVHTAYGLVLQTGYRKADFSVVYPTARGTGPAITVIIAILFFGNSPSIEGFLGIAAIILGIFLLALPSKAQALEQEKISKGIFWGTLTGVCIASYSSIDAAAIQLLGIAPLAFFVPGLLVRVLILAPSVLGQKSSRTKMIDHLKTTPQETIIVALAHPLAYMLILYALVSAPLAYVAPAREVSMLIALFLGAAMLKEKIPKLRIFGVVLMIAGISLIAFDR